MSASFTHDLIDRNLLRSDWYGQVMHAASELHEAVHDALTQRIARLARRAQSIGSAAAKDGPDIVIWLEGRAMDDAIAAAESLLDLRAPATFDDAMALALECSRLAPTSVAVLAARARLLSVLNDRPTLTEGIKSGTQLLRRFVVRARS